MMRLQTDLGDCADAYVMVAKNTSMTGQNIQVGKEVHRAYRQRRCTDEYRCWIKRREHVGCSNVENVGHGHVH